MKDIYNNDKNLDNELRALNNSDISNNNKETILKFKRYLEINSYSKKRIIKYLTKRNLDIYSELEFAREIEKIGQE